MPQSQPETGIFCCFSYIFCSFALKISLLTTIRVQLQMLPPQFFRAYVAVNLTLLRAMREPPGVLGDYVVYSFWIINLYVTIFVVKKN